MTTIIDGAQMNTELEPLSFPPKRLRRGLWMLLECPECGAPNGRHRLGCFNCGSLIQPGSGGEEPPLVRVVVGDADNPGRVVYVRR